MAIVNFSFRGMILTAAGPQTAAPPEMALSPSESGGIAKQLHGFLKNGRSFQTNCPLPGGERIVIVSLQRVGLTAATGFVSVAVPGRPPLAKAALALLPNLDPREDQSAVAALRKIVELKPIADDVFFAPLAATEPLSALYLADDVSAQTPAIFTFAKLLAAAFFSQLGVGQAQAS